MFPMRDVESCEGHEPRAIAFERHESGIPRTKSFGSKVKSMSNPLFPFTNSGSPILPPHTMMLPGQFLKSPSQRFQFILQTDGSLVIYEEGVAVWSAQEREPYYRYSTPAESKSAGNYVATQYDVLFNDVTRNRRWSATTTNPLGGDILLASYRTYLSLQDDGNLVLNDTFPLWVTYKSLEAFSLFSTDLIIKPGESFVPGQRREAGTNFLQFQPDGNFVLYNAQNVPLWNSGTQGTGADLAVMQEDGNFVIYAGSKAVWNTQTAGNPDAYLRVQSNGVLSVVIDKPVWARFGFTPKVLPRKKWTMWGPVNIPVWPFPKLPF